MQSSRHRGTCVFSMNPPGTPVSFTSTPRTRLKKLHGTAMCRNAILCKPGTASVFLRCLQENGWLSPVCPTRCSSPNGYTTTFPQSQFETPHQRSRMVRRNLRFIATSKTFFLPPLFQELPNRLRKQPAAAQPHLPSRLIRLVEQLFINR